MQTSKPVKRFSHPLVTKVVRIILVCSGHIALTIVVTHFMISLVPMWQCYNFWAFSSSQTPTKGCSFCKVRVMASVIRPSSLLPVTPASALSLVDPSFLKSIFIIKTNQKNYLYSWVPCSMESQFAPWISDCFRYTFPGLRLSRDLRYVRHFHVCSHVTS